MWDRIWRSLKNFFRRWGGKPTLPAEAPLNPLSDLGYEHLFFSLLRGVEQGWEQGQVLAHLGKRLEDRSFLAWLRRFGGKLRQSATPQRELAAQMVRLGELGCGKLGNVAADLGQELLTRGVLPMPQPEAEPIASVEEAVAWLNRGLQQYEAGDFQGAIASWEKAIELKLNYPEAFYNKGNALYALGRTEEAIVAYDQALKIKPGLREAFSNKGAALSALGRKEEAIVVYDQALKIKPDDHGAFYNKGNALSALGRIEEAIVAYDQALKIKPDLDEAFSNKGNALSALGRIEEAIAAYNQALKIKPDDHGALSNKGVALSDLGRIEEAIAAYNQALKIKPDDHGALSNKGNALYRLRRYEEAIAAYDQALTLEPDRYAPWIGRGSAAGNSVQSRTLPSLLLLQNPELNQRGYEGRLASYQEGLKHVWRETQPQGWGALHRAFGRAHYSRGQTSVEREPRRRNREAVRSFHTALETLTESTFPKDYLETLQYLIRAYLSLGETEAAKHWREQGLRVFHDLLNAQPSDRQRQLLETKFSGFSQIAVDTLVQDGQIIAALEAAERYKNRCLTWMLTAWQPQVTSPSYAQMQRLLDVPLPTAILYWHLSPDTLTLFLLKPHVDPLSLSAQPRQAQRLNRFKPQRNRLGNGSRNVSRSWRSKKFERSCCKSLVSTPSTKPATTSSTSSIRARNASRVSAAHRL